jgi:anti-anti-sigma regulatory factor
MASCCGAYYDGILRVIWACRPPVVLIAGEIDESRYSGLVSALERPANFEGDIHVNLAELAFCDLAGLRAILRLARTGRADEGRGGSCLVLHDVPPHLRMVLEILGWDSTPGLIIEAAQLTANPHGMASAGPAPNGEGTATCPPSRLRARSTARRASWNGGQRPAPPLVRDEEAQTASVRSATS